MKKEKTRYEASLISDKRLEANTKIIGARFQRLIPILDPASH